MYSYTNDLLYHIMLCQKYYIFLKTGSRGGRKWRKITSNSITSKEVKNLDLWNK